MTIARAIAICIAMQPVYRFEAEGEEGVPFPILLDAAQDDPLSLESYIATSVGGVRLVTAHPIDNAGHLSWVLSLCGEDVCASAGWLGRINALTWAAYCQIASCHVSGFAEQQMEVAS